MNFSKYLIFFSLFHSSIINPADSKCQKSFQCGKLGSLEYPLSPFKDPGCGLFVVDDCDSENPRIHFGAGGIWYDILKKLSLNKFLIRNHGLQGHLNKKSCLSFTNMSLPRSPYSSFTVSPALTLFTCSQYNWGGLIDHFVNYSYINCSSFTVFYKYSANGVYDPGENTVPPECSTFQAPIKSNQDQDSSELYSLLTAEFTLEWNLTQACYDCHRGGGQCLSNSMNEFYCRKCIIPLIVGYIYGRHDDLYCVLSENHAGKRTFKKIFLIGGVITAVTSTSIILIHFIRRKYKLHRLFGFQKEKPGNEKDIELFLRNNGNLAPVRYKYSDIKKMTKSFSEVLGKGRYGSVYKGKLLDGPLVAVKILNESQENGEEFMNEVASIIRTSHVNIVSLLGFCFEGSKRALIYEFMPNGSLEKFIRNTASSSLVEGGLGWQKLFEIALGIARGLEYLHQGCKTKILHFDIKPHNILLDRDMNPRISDFGLAKLCPNRSSVVSMLVARGTLRYIAPEVFCRNFGEVSHKSDVYSYGMIVLEIAGRKKDPIDDSTIEIYFSEYYKLLEMGAERDGSLVGIMDEDENQLVRQKLIIVGLWCLQIDPKNRPSMTKVVEMLEGKLESLQVPPKPYLFPPPRSVSNSESM